MSILDDNTIYGTLERLKDNYISDFQKQNEYDHLLSYLKNLKRKYDEVWNLTKTDMDELFANPKRTDEWKKEHDILTTIRENHIQIHYFLEFEIAKQKAVILDRGQKGTPPPPPEEEPPLTSNQIQIVGLFKRSGIIKYLRDKNPKISDAKLSKFLREITAHYLENAESVRPHLTNDTNSVKHPFYKNDNKNQYDLILNKYGISPQSDE